MFPDDDGVYRESFASGDGTTLRAGVILENGRPVVVEWRFERDWEEDTSLTVWDGQFPG